jgi:exosome complex component RRP40
MATAIFVLPGEEIDPELLPSLPKQPLKLGPGLRHIPPNTIVPTVAGQLFTDQRKNAAWVEYHASRVCLPAPLHNPADRMQVRPNRRRSRNSHNPNATLPQLSFEGASKKTRPMLTPGSLVYARVTLANKHMDPELECVSPTTGKSDGLGPLTGGMVFGVSLSMARRLMLPRPSEQGGLTLLDELGGQGLPFEIAVGRNGKVWIDSGKVAVTLGIGKALQETDEKGLSAEEQKKLSKKATRDI